MAVVVDTDVISYLFKGDSRARGFWPHLIGQEGILSFMTLAELHRWSLSRNWGRATRRRFDEYIEEFTIYHADGDLCRLWAEVTHRARQKGRPIDTADAWIAATALILGVSLVTHNASDFSGVDGLTLLTATKA